jgi:hypothetical protein
VLERIQRNHPVSVNQLLSSAPALSKMCPLYCMCISHKHMARYIRLCSGKVRSLLFSLTGSLFNPRACNVVTCRKGRGRCRECMVYCSPTWLSFHALALHILGVGRIQISLSFPRVLLPDSDFSVCIRTGRIQRIKEALASGEVPVADIAAP